MSGEGKAGSQKALKTQFMADICKSLRCLLGWGKPHSPSAPEWHLFSEKDVGEKIPRWKLPPSRVYVTSISYWSLITFILNSYDMSFREKKLPKTFTVAGEN